MILGNAFLYVLPANSNAILYRGTDEWNRYDSEDVATSSTNYYFTSYLSQITCKIICPTRILNTLYLKYIHTCIIQYIIYSVYILYTEYCLIQKFETQHTHLRFHELFITLVKSTWVLGDNSEVLLAAVRTACSWIVCWSVPGLRKHSPLPSPNWWPQWPV